MYWNSSQYYGMNGCINPSNLNFHLEQCRHLFLDETANGGLRQPGYGLKSLDMYGLIGTAPPSYTIYMHNANIRYAFLHMGPTPSKSLFE